MARMVGSCRGARWHGSGWWLGGLAVLNLVLGSGCQGTNGQLTAQGQVQLDRRALEINTENGLFIDSADFCGVLAEHVDWLMESENAWHVTIDEDNRVRWESAGEVRYTQPARSVWQRISDWLLRWVPIESQL